MSSHLSDAETEKGDNLVVPEPLKLVAAKLQLTIQEKQAQMALEEPSPLVDRSSPKSNQVSPSPEKDVI